MLPKRNRKRRRRVSLMQTLRERHARVALWRFKRSPEQRDRAAAFGTFAFIAAFAIGSVDAIITGGADFGPTSAYAGEYAPARVTPLVQPAAAVLEPVEAAPAPEKDASDLVDYSVATEELLGGPEDGLEANAAAEAAAELLKSIPL
jgi:hypothetical protein